MQSPEGKAQFRAEMVPTRRTNFHIDTNEAKRLKLEECLKVDRSLFRSEFSPSHYFVSHIIFDNQSALEASPRWLEEERDTLGPGLVGVGGHFSPVEHAWLWTCLPCAGSVPHGLSDTLTGGTAPAGPLGGGSGKQGSP